jgi:hypothetical protein
MLIIKSSLAFYLGCKSNEKLAAFSYELSAISFELGGGIRDQVSGIRLEE